MERYVYVGTNFHSAEERDSTARFTRAKNAKDFPKNVTLGFRNNFWRVFSSLTEYDKADFEFTWLGRKWMFVSMWVVESNSTGDISTYLDEKHNVITVFLLKLLDDEDASQLRQWHFDHGLSEQEALAALFKSFDGRPFAGYLATFRHKMSLNALFTWSVPEGTIAKSNPSNVTALFAFYCFAMLVIWNISREITFVDLSTEQRQFRETLSSVMRIRGRIINLDRYFLTKNISNEREVLAVSRDIRKSFALVEKQSRFLPLVDAMEKQIQTASQIRADINSRRLNAIVLISAVVALPLSLMSMLLAYNPDAVPILKDGIAALSKGDAVTFFAATSALALAIICLLFVLVEFFSGDKQKKRRRTS